MNERFRHPIVLRTLDFASRLLSYPLFLPLHLLAQATHLVLTRRALERYFRNQSPLIRSLRFRRSVTSWRSFHLLLSDLDVTLIVDDSFTKWRELDAIIQRTRGLFLLLGEFEVYTQTEFNEKTAAERFLDPFHSVVRDVRKLSWLTSNEAPYHRLKQQRAKTKIEKSLGEWLTGSLADGWMKKARTIETRRWDPENFDRVKNYLHGNSDVLMSQPELTGLLMTLPGPLTADLLVSMSELEIQMHVAFCRLEAHTAMARSRFVTATEADQLSQWSHELNREIERCHEELDARAKSSGAT